MAYALIGLGVGFIWSSWDADIMRDRTFVAFAGKTCQQPMPCFKPIYGTKSHNRGAADSSISGNM